MREITLSFADIRPTVTRSAAIELKSQLDRICSDLRAHNLKGETLIRMIADSIDHQLKADIEADMEECGILTPFAFDK